MSEVDILVTFLIPHTVSILSSNDMRRTGFLSAFWSEAARDDDDDDDDDDDGRGELMSLLRLGGESLKDEGLMGFIGI